MTQWLYQKLKAVNKDQPEKHFANSASVLWMRALAKMLEDEAQVSKNLDKISINTVSQDSDYDFKLAHGYEALYKSYQNYNSLVALIKSDIPSVDIVRTAIVNWYYTVHFSAKASIYTHQKIREGKQNTHAGVAKAWAGQFSTDKKNLSPFALKVSSVEKAACEKQIAKMKSGSKINMNHFHGENEIETAEDALAVHLSYLNGTATGKRKDLQKRIKDDKEYALLATSHEKRKYTIKKWDKNPIGFLDLAYRFRVKTHYKDAFFFGYGSNDIELLERFVTDLELVARSFLKVSSRHIRTGFGEENWGQFVEDMEQENKLSTNFFH